MTEQEHGHAMTRARAAAGALFTDEHDRIMLVHPAYKQHLDIPGGYIEPGETPSAACAREVNEELGIKPALGPLLVVDWAPRHGEGDKILFVFDGGQLTPDDRSRIRLNPAELTGYDYYDLDQAERVLIARMAARLRHALTARRLGRPLYLERGQPVT